MHNKQEPMYHISSFYHIDMYRAAYQFKTMSFRGKRFYKMDQILPIETSPFEKNRGRPKNKGIREENEQISKHYGTKLSKKKGYILHTPSTSNKDTIKLVA